MKGPLVFTNVKLLDSVLFTGFLLEPLGRNDSKFDLHKFQKKRKPLQNPPFFWWKTSWRHDPHVFFSIWKAELRHLLRKRICGGNLQESRPVVILFARGVGGGREMSLDFLGLYIALKGVRFFSYVASINLRNKMWFGYKVSKMHPKKYRDLNMWSLKICPKILLWRSKMWTCFLGSRWWFQSFYMFTRILGVMIQFD